MRNKSVLLWAVLWINLAVGATPALAAPAAKPRLVVLIAIDQMRSDYLTRFENLYLPARRKDGAVGGFRYLMNNGAYFKSAVMPHALTVTAIGHATMLTGALPYLHGIIAHRYFDFETRKKTYCVEDSTAPIVGGVGVGAGDGRSPRNLLVTTVGDEMKNAWGGRPLVAGVSLKDRAAILMGGHRADLVLWFDDATRGFVTSKYYAKDGKLPAWLERWNKQDYTRKRAPKSWSLLLPAKDYWLSTPMSADYTAWKRLGTKEFPHPIKDDARAFTITPWGNALVFDTALELAKNMRFGADEIPDLLTVSLSSFDALGHAFGFMSIEMQDMALRTDRMLADFLNGLDRLVPGGLKNVAIVLTADHGVPINPAYAEEQHMPGGAFWGGPLTEKGNELLRKKFGFGSDEKPIVSFEESNIALDHELLQKRDKSVLEVSRSVAEWLRGEPFVAAAYAKGDVLEGRIAPTPISRRLAVSTHATRSGDIVFAPRPGYSQYWDNTKTGAVHESAGIQDASVPLIFAGRWFKPGRYSEEPSMADLAPTLSSVLGIIPPSGSSGKPLSKIIP